MALQKMADAPLLQKVCAGAPWLRWEKLCKVYRITRADLGTIAGGNCGIALLKQKGLNMETGNNQALENAKSCDICSECGRESGKNPNCSVCRVHNACVKVSKDAVKDAGNKFVVPCAA
jgi:hypothetical protein